MLPLEKIKDYVNTVCLQIRWKKARSRVSEEMTNHITDGRDSFMSQGFDENAATDKAIAEAGDAIDIGTQLDRIHRPKPQWGMFAATGILLILGVFARLTTFQHLNLAGFISLFVGIVGMIAAYFMDFTIIRKYPKVIYISVVIISLAVLINSPRIFGLSYYGQYVVFLFPIAFIGIIYIARNKGCWGICFCMLAAVIPGIIAIAVPTISGLFLLGLVEGTLLCIAIYKNWFGTKRLYNFILIFVPAILAAIVFIPVLTPNLLERLAVAVNPTIDQYGAGYMGVMTRDLLSGAAWIGKGNIPSGYDYLFNTPYSVLNTDLFLTGIISRSGWITFVVILVALLFFIVKGFILCFKQKSSLGLFVSVAIMLTLSIQAISYIVYNLGFQVVSPISLPLISYNNTATIINLILIGFMLSVFRTGDVVTDGKTQQSSKHQSFITWSDGKLIFNFKAL